ncbi:DoxX family protein [Mycobacterium sp. 852002-51057_SCH5723018]|uniref:DoxX family protein n=1 Tax=Mycobacterium sp. 852002-51057_SCH5723018 TaxID=1834094 RepID=UPI0012E8A9E1
MLLVGNARNDRQEDPCADRHRHSHCLVGVDVPRRRRRQARRRPSVIAHARAIALDGRLWSSIGLLEVTACLGLAAGLAVPALGLAVSIGLVLLMIGSIVAHIRVGDVGGAAPAALLVVLVVTLIILRATTGH